jgi:hypothetical protein
MLSEVNSLEIMNKTLSNFNIHIIPIILLQIHLALSFMAAKHHLGNNNQDSNLSNLIQLTSFLQQFLATSST